MTNDRIGWVFDAHLCSAQQEMIVWIISHNGSVFSYREAWMPTLHVAGESKHLHHLLDWLWQPEVRTKYEFNLCIRNQTNGIRFARSATHARSDASIM